MLSNQPPKNTHRDLAATKGQKETEINDALRGDFEKQIAIPLKEEQKRIVAEKGFAAFQATARPPEQERNALIKQKDESIQKLSGEIEGQNAGRCTRRRKGKWRIVRKKRTLSRSFALLSRVAPQGNRVRCGGARCHLGREAMNSPRNCTRRRRSMKRRTRPCARILKNN